MNPNLRKRTETDSGNHVGEQCRSWKNNGKCEKT